MFCGVYADGAEPIGTDGRGDRLGNEINRKASGAAAAGEPLHTKAQLVTFMRYRGRRDLLEALLICLYRESPEHFFRPETAMATKVWEVQRYLEAVSYTHLDITLISKICEILQITEHEFITASDDSAARMEKKQAKRYRGFVKTCQIGLCAGYGIALVTCFICNLAIQHALSWFFIVLAALALAFSLTILPALLHKHRLLITFGTATVLTYLLVFTCCCLLYTSVPNC